MKKHKVKTNQSDLTQETSLLKGHFPSTPLPSLYSLPQEETDVNRGRQNKTIYSVLVLSYTII